MKAASLIAALLTLAQARAQETLDKPLLQNAPKASPLKLAPLEDDFTDPRGGGAGSVMRTGSDAFSLPFKNATVAHHRSFIVGNALFKENWVTAPASVKSRQGLGPIFNAQSCSTCHFKDGRGLPPEDANEVPTGLLVRLSVPGKNVYGGPQPHPIYGDQIQHRANVGIEPEADVAIDYEKIKGSYGDGTAYELRKPVIKISKLRNGPLGENTLFSARIAPQVIGLGLLEAIPEKQILAHADADDTNHDGISGRPNWVWNFSTHRRELGRFGWKSNQPSVRQQGAAAFAGDMGITSKLFSQTNCATGAEDCAKAYRGPQPELSDLDLEDVTTYDRLLAVPFRRNVGDADTLKGRALFRQANCQACHVSQYTTGTVAGFPELSRQTVRPYSDLLLHDMGDGLADGRPDFEADGREWRTPPLWGVGLAQDVAGRTRLLHDGRARDVNEAVLWHGGEALAARETYRNYSAGERANLVKFVESL